MSQYDAIREMQREIRWLKNEMAKRPIKTRGGSPTAQKWIKIDRGNTLNDGITLGIKYVAGGVATVPSLYDPTVTSTFIDGIGRGTLYVNGTDSGLVLVVNANIFNVSIIVQALFTNDRVQAITTVAIPLAGDPTQSVTCYVPYFI